jgi:osmotically-inducible protein OsmY
MRAALAREGSMSHRLARTTIAAFVLLGIAACSQSPEEQFREATEHLEEAQAELEQAQERMDRKQEAVDAAREELEAAREVVAKAEEGVSEARSKVREMANDEVLFRAVQTRLLTEFEDAAVDADVQDGVVTLTGEVPNESVREEAAELARSVPGVADVQNRLQIPAQEPAPAPKPAPTTEPAPPTPPPAG